MKRNGTSSGAYTKGNSFGALESIHEIKSIQKNEQSKNMATI